MIYSATCFNPMRSSSGWYLKHIKEVYTPSDWKRHLASYKLCYNPVFVHSVPDKICNNNYKITINILKSLNFIIGGVGGWPYEVPLTEFVWRFHIEWSIRYEGISHSVARVLLTLWYVAYLHWEFKNCDIVLHFNKHWTVFYTVKTKYLCFYTFLYFICSIITFTIIPIYLLHLKTHTDDSPQYHIQYLDITL
jgi:hypothetical protein